MCDKNFSNHTYHALIFLLILSLLVLPDIPNPNHLLNDLTDTIRSHATTSGGNNGGDFPSPPCTTTTTSMILAFLYGALLTLVLMIISKKWSLISSKQIDDQHQPSTSGFPCYTPEYGPTDDVGGADGEGVGYVVLRTFPTFAYSTRPKPKMGKGAKACVICQYKFRDQEMVRWLPNCDHLFHISCIDEWLKSRRTCPCCRAQLDFPSNNYGLVTNDTTISPNDFYDYSNEYY